MKLVDNAKNAWKWFSVQALAISGAMPLVWLNIPDEMRNTIPPDYVMLATCVMAVLGLIGRVVDQRNA